MGKKEKSKDEKENINIVRGNECVDEDRDERESEEKGSKKIGKKRNVNKRVCSKRKRKSERKEECINGEKCK